MSSNLIQQPYPIILNPHGGGGSAKPAANAEYHVGEYKKDAVQHPRSDLFYKDEEGTERAITSPIYTNNSGAFVASKSDGTVIQPYMKEGVGYSVCIKGRRGTIYESKAVGDPGNLNEKIAELTDIVYKASGGKSAFENMIDGIPVAVSVGDISQANGIHYKRIASSGLASDFAVIGGTYSTLKALIDDYDNLPDGQSFDVVSFWEGWSALRYPLGGGSFVKNSKRSKAAHNGGLFISPTVAWDGSYDNLEDWLKGVGETDPDGKGCFVRQFNGDECWVEWFGAKGDATTLDSPAIDAAVNSKFNVRFRIAEYILTRALKPHPGQSIKGSGLPQISAQNKGIATVLRYKADVNGYGTSYNIANGSRIEDVYMVLDGSVTSTNDAIRYGIPDVQGGSSQGIRCQAINVLIVGPWFNGLTAQGWSWELELRNVHVNGFLNRGFKITRAANIINAYGCTAMASIGTANDGLGLSINGQNQTAGPTAQVYSVNFYGFRSENNRLAIRAEGGATVNFYGLYLEGNRFGDIQVRDPYTQVYANGVSLIHGNAGNTTAAAIIVQGDSTTGLIIDGITYKVTDGTVESFFQGDSDHYSEINKIQWQGDGVPYQSTPGKFAPSKMTFVKNPELTLYRRGDGSNQMVGEARDNSGKPTDDVLFRIVDFDGNTKSLLTPGSRVIDTGTSNPEVLDYFYNGSSWLTRSLTTA